MTEDQIQQLLERYTRGQASEEERRKLDLWYAEQGSSSNWDITANRKAELLATTRQNLQNQLFPPEKRTKGRYWMAAAATVLICLSTWFAIQAPIFKSAKPEDFIVQSAGKGRMVKITLEDGSRLTLNAGTSVKYLKKFSGKERRIILMNGEAYFDVQHEANRPFIVESGGVTTQVLGTAFNIASYKTSDDIRVTVTRGKVSVMHNRQKNDRATQTPVILFPNDQVIVEKLTGKIDKNKVAANDVIGWVDGKLIFVSEKMSNVASILDERFQTHITFEDDTIKRFRISAGFEPSDNIDDILFALSKANNLIYAKRGRNIVISLQR